MLKKQKEKREEEAELRKVKREAEVWKYINRKRKKKAWKDNNIGEEEWRMHFKNLLGGKKKEERKKEEKRKKIRAEGGEELVIGEEEIRNAVKKMKMKKAAERWDPHGSMEICREKVMEEICGTDKADRKRRRNKA